MQVYDKGRVLNLTGAAITVGYVAGTTVTDAAATAVGVFFHYTTDAASAAADFRIKLQAKDNDANAQWYDIATTRASTGATGDGANAAEHVIAGGSGIAWTSDALFTSSGFMASGGLRVLVKATTTAGTGTDQIIATLKLTEE